MFARRFDADGDTVVVWDPNANGISGRRFDLLGNPMAAASPAVRIGAGWAGDR